MVGCDKVCKICGAAEETIIHMLFHCTIPRVVWFSSPLALRTDGIHDNLDKVLPNLWEGLGVMQKSQFAYLMWEIWKGRCVFLYGGKKQTATAVRMAAIMGSKRILEAGGIHTDTENGAGARVEVMQEGNSHQCWVDGSFSVPDQGGVGYWLENNEGLVQYGLKHFEAYSPFQMEAMALVLAMQGVRDKQISACTFYSDSEEICHILNSSEKPKTVDWRAYWEVETLGQMRDECKGFTYVHINREGNSRAHKLAILARTGRFSYQGYTFPFFERM